MYRQGDVLIVPVPADQVPARKSLRYVRRKKGEGVILAAGEATGHHHRVREKGAREFRLGSGKGTVRFLFTGKAGGTVTHEEHDPIPLPADSVFKIVQQREYEPVITDNTVRQSERRVYD
jgi:hypothetical protein